MNKKITSIVISTLFALVILCGSLLCIFKPSARFSKSERRELASFPKVTTESIFNGNFMSDFETYATERFPFRDTFRGIKAWFSTKVLNKLDNNGLFVADGHISKIDTAKNPEMMEYAADKFENLYQLYLKGKTENLYFSIIPDKNFILAKENGYPSLDYKAFIEEMKSKTEYMEYIDVTELLQLEDYYSTDTHWRQENIVDIAEKIANAMNTDIKADYKINKLENPFFGVYHGQLAIPFDADEILYLTNDTIDNSIVTYYDTGKPKSGQIYNMEKAFGKDPYEMFLSGTTPLVTIENPSAKSTKELVIFRDSFGSSLAPLFVEGYSKITAVDIRYIQSSFVGNFVDFDNCDVLFLYSTTLLNNSMAMK